MLLQFDFVDWISHPPGSMIFIFFLATAVALISTFLTKWLTDVEETQRKQKLIKARKSESGGSARIKS